MSLRLRQVALVAEDLEPTVAGLCDALDVEICFRDPEIIEFGLHNALMPIGETLLEVVSPVQDGTTAGRYLQRRGGDGGYMVIFQVDDINSARERLSDRGVRVVWRADHDDISGTHLHPRDVPGAIVSIDEARPPESWRWAGADWRPHIRTGTVSSIVGVELQTDRADELAAAWAGALGIEATDQTLHLDEGQRIDFVPITDSRPEGICTLIVKATDPSRSGDTLKTAGVTVRFE